MSFRSQVLSALKWTLIGRFSTQFISWAITIVVMRLLVPEDYGLIAMATIFSGLFALVAEIGLGSSLVQAQEVSEVHLRQVFAIVLLSNFAVFLILALIVAPLAALFFAEPRLQSLIQVVALQFIPAAFCVLPSAILDREMQYRERSILDFTANLVGGLSTLAMAYGGYGPWSLAWGTVIAGALRAAGLCWLKPYKALPLFRFAGSGQMMRFGRDVAASQIVYYLYSQVDSLIVGKLLGRHDLGLYSVAINLASMPASRMASILNQVAFPAMSKAKRDGENVSFYILKSMRGISLVAFPVMWGMSSVTPEIVAGLLGDNWTAATMPLTLLCLIMPLRILGPIIHAGLQSVGHADVSFRNICTTAVVMCAAFIVGCQFGLFGLAMAWVLVLPVMFVANLARACPHFELPLSHALATTYKPAFASALMYGAVTSARQWLTLDALPQLAVLVVVGAVVYLIANLLFNKEGVSEFIRLLKPAKT
ncbi:MAG TPA: lipopolysaccharide biosynthesis protein [Accumulibacter sp.]|jgi:O-antigen/teichoic acid export membrane protein|nr:lipopolysaccharide biosynthesis protein [Accumulibacter sp.]HQC79218.1 lipopolysaccharide biosynthesis protein [Accumulibacter sp.]